MNRIDSIFEQLRRTGRGGLMPFLCGGRPDAAGMADILRTIDGAGASIIEVGIPYSDPIADGPVISAAMHQALSRGVTRSDIFDAVRSVRSQVKAGLVAMVTVSIVHRLGVERFVTEASEAGFDGFIFPDAPLEEADGLVEAARAAGMTASLLIAPSTSAERAGRIAEASSGFVYLLARAGITGERDEAPEVADRVAMIREATELPIACGFGISQPDHVRAVVEHADAAIVGSALVRRIEAAVDGGGDPVEEAGRFVATLATGLAREGSTS